MKETKVTNKLYVENAFIFRKNFRGEKTEYNTDGKRNFYLKLDPDLADQLHDDGWNVQQAPAREEGEPPLNYLPVEIRYNNQNPMLDPDIYLVTSRKKTKLDESNVGILDTVRFKNVSIRVNPYNWKVGSKIGVKAYVDKMYIEIEEDPMDIKYANIPDGELAGY